MKITPESRVVTKVPTSGVTLAAPPRMPARTMTAMTMAEMPSAAKSMKGEVVVIWMTAAEMRPITSAWLMLGRTMRMVRQNAEMMNSGLIMPADMDEMALPTVKLRMRPAASRMASRTRARISSLPWSLAVTVRAAVFWDMVCSFWCVRVCAGGTRWLRARRLRGAGGPVGWRRAMRGAGRCGCRGKKKGPRSNRRPKKLAARRFWRDRTHRRPTKIASRHHQFITELLAALIMSASPFAESRLGAVPICWKEL